MKSFISLLVVLITAGIVLFFFQEPIAAAGINFVYRSACDRPLAYNVGEVDPEFGISKEEFASRIQEAEAVWNAAYEKKLFMYDPKAKFTINMIYDGRQTLNNKINELESNVETGKSSLKPEIAEYDRRSQAFQSRLEAFRDKVRYWNEKGGAPPEEYEKLTSEQEELKSEADALNQMAKNLNQSTEEFNQKVGELNDSINNYNAALYEKPEGGIYDPRNNRIDIFFNNGPDELLHTIAHELGHAIGTDHVPTENSIMYSKTNGNTTLSQEDIAELKRVCAKKDIVTIAKDNVVFLTTILQQRITGDTAASTAH